VLAIGVEVSANKKLNRLIITVGSFRVLWAQFYKSMSVIFERCNKLEQ
jgi:hypothetical protein